MPDVMEVYEMVTKQKQPDPGALERQRSRQIRTTRNRKVGALVVAAAIATVAIAFVVSSGTGSDRTTVGTNPKVTTSPASSVDGTLTFDGSTCSVELASDRIEPGVLLFDVVNTANRAVMIDSYELSDAYTFGAFRGVVERTRRQIERGTPRSGLAHWPEMNGPDQQVTYLGSDVVPAGSSDTIASTMYSGRAALVCMARYDRAHPSIKGFHPTGIVGPITVG